METLSEMLEAQFNLDAAILINLLFSLLIFLILWMARRAILRLAFRRTEDVKLRYNWRKTTGYLLYFLLALSILPLWVQNGTGLTTYLGLLSAGIAIALKDPLSNLAGWVFIVWRHPFRVGDRIQIGSHAGDVIDLRIFQFSLMEIGNWVAADQSTGRIIHIPNGQIFTHPMANYTHGFHYLWNEIPVTITFESDWEKAKAILQEIAGRHSVKPVEGNTPNKKVGDEYLLYYQHLTPTVYTRVIDRGVDLTIRYLCEPRQRRGTSQAIWEDVLRVFAAHPDIELAYPTTRFVSEEVLPGETGLL
jgi:small-conductance mechanosensitive channel